MKRAHLGYAQRSSWVVGGTGPLVLLLAYSQGKMKQQDKEQLKRSGDQEQVDCKYNAHN